MRSLSRQEYLRPPLWSGRIALGKLIISMSFSHKDEMPQEYPRISSRLKSLRQERGMSHQTLASRLRISDETLQAMEEGSYFPSVTLALRISRLFDVPIETIFSYE